LSRTHHWTICAHWFSGFFRRVDFNEPRECELVERRGFPVVLRQSAMTVLMRKAESVLPIPIALIGGQAVKACGFSVVFGQSAAAGRVEKAEPDLRERKAFFCGEPVEARGFLLALRQTAVIGLSER